MSLNTVDVVVKTHKITALKYLKIQQYQKFSNQLADAVKGFEKSAQLECSIHSTRTISRSSCLLLALLADVLVNGASLGRAHA